MKDVIFRNKLKYEIITKESETLYLETETWNDNGRKWKILVRKILKYESKMGMPIRVHIQIRCW